MDSNFKVNNSPGNSFNENLFLLTAHNLKSTFNAVLNISKHIIIGLDTMSSEDIRDCLNMIYNCSNTMHESLDNFIIRSKIKTGSLSLNNKKLDLDKLIKEIIVNAVDLNQAVSNKNVAVIYPGYQNLFLFIDELMISTVIKNLLSNALKFTGTDGKVIIEVIDEKNSIIISVKDTGTGMTKTELADLFNNILFSKSGASGEKGAGLGLILCKEILEMYNGSIWVESKIGKGSCFWVRVGK